MPPACPRYLHVPPPPRPPASVAPSSRGKVINVRHVRIPVPVPARITAGDVLVPPVAAEVLRVRRPAAGEKGSAPTPTRRAAVVSRRGFLPDRASSRQQAPPAPRSFQPLRPRWLRGRQAREVKPPARETAGPSGVDEGWRVTRVGGRRRRSEAAGKPPRSRAPGPRGFPRLFGHLSPQKRPRPPLQPGHPGGRAGR